MAPKLARSKGFARVKAADGAADPADGSPKIYKFRANDGDFDRYQDRNAVSGWQLDNFNANPVILWMHDDASGGAFGGSSDRLPIGRGRAYVEGDALMVDIEFDQGDEFAKQIEGKVERGILNAVSVRYLMHKYHENEQGGFDSDEQELLEISVVVIPGNQRATRIKAESDTRAELIKEIVAAVVKAMDAQQSAEQVTPAPTTPAVPDLATEPEATAAAEVLAAEAEPFNVDAIAASFLDAFTKGLTQ